MKYKHAKRKKRGKGDIIEGKNKREERQEEENRVRKNKAKL